jgi:hypothetical protein
VRLAARDRTDAAIAKPETPFVRVDELGGQFPGMPGAPSHGQNRLRARDRLRRLRASGGALFAFSAKTGSVGTIAFDTACWMTIGGKRWRRYEISTSRQPTRVVSPRPSGYPDKACARLSVRSAQTGPIRRRRRIDADLDRLSGEDRDICSRPCPARTPASAPCPVRPRQNRQQASGSRPLPGLLAWSLSSGNSAARLTLPISEQTSCDTSAIPPRPPAGR